MPIVPIEKLPEKPTSDYEAAQAKAIQDVIQIIRERIPLCEITMDVYSGNYMRSAIHCAIRRASEDWFQRRRCADWFQRLRCEDQYRWQGFCGGRYRL